MEKDETPGNIHPYPCGCRASEPSNRDLLPMKSKYNEFGDRLKRRSQWLGLNNLPYTYSIYIIKCNVIDNIDSKQLKSFP